MLHQGHHLWFLCLSHQVIELLCLDDRLSTNFTFVLIFVIYIYIHILWTLDSEKCIILKDNIDFVINLSLNLL